MDERFSVVKKVPKDALKPIGAGKLAKMSDINAQWRIEAMTETYGLCGFGWKYEVVKEVHQPMQNGEILLYMQVNLYIKDNETKEWSAPISAWGGDYLIKKEKEKLVGQDEAYKKCMTDALGKAMSVIGVASDIYRGCWDGSKYIDKTIYASDEPEEKPAPVQRAEAQLGGEATKIPYVKVNNGHTQIFYKNAWRYLEHASVETLNDITNNEIYAACHDEARKLMMAKAQ